jgi:hypothetical protein
MVELFALLAYGKAWQMVGALESLQCCLSDCMLGSGVTFCHATATAGKNSDPPEVKALCKLLGGPGKAIKAALDIMVGNSAAAQSEVDKGNMTKILVEFPDMSIDTFKVPTLPAILELKTRKKKGDDGSETEQTLYKKLELPAQSPPDDEELVQQEHAALQALDQKLAEYNMMSHEYLVAYDQRYKVVEELLESMQALQGTAADAAMQQVVAAAGGGGGVQG